MNTPFFQFLQFHFPAILMELEEFKRQIFKELKPASTPICSLDPEFQKKLDDQFNFFAKNFFSAFDQKSLNENLEYFLKITDEKSKYPNAAIFIPDIPQNPTTQLYIAKTNDNQLHVGLLFADKAIKDFIEKQSLLMFAPTIDRSTIERLVTILFKHLSEFSKFYYEVDTRICQIFEYAINNKKSVPNDNGQNIPKYICQQFLFYCDEIRNSFFKDQKPIIPNIEQIIQSYQSFYPKHKKNPNSTSNNFEELAVKANKHKQWENLTATKEKLMTKMPDAEVIKVLDKAIHDYDKFTTKDYFDLNRIISNHFSRPGNHSPTQVDQDCNNEISQRFPFLKQ